MDSPQSGWRRLNVGVVGGGIGGMSVAIAMRRAGHDVTIYERNDFAGEVGASVSCAANGTRWLHEWEVDVAKGDPVVLQKLINRDWKTGEPVSVYDLDDYEKRWGHVYNMFHRQYMHAMLKDTALQEEKAGTPAKLVINHPCKDIDMETGTITFINGNSAQHDVIIGADGIGSVVRKIIGLNPVKRPSDSSCLHCNVDTEEAVRHGLVDYSQNSALEYWGGQEGKWDKIVLSPCNGGRLLSYYCFFPRALGDYVNQTWGAEDRPVEELLNPYPNLDPQVKAHLAIGKDIQPWRLWVHEPYEYITRGQVCLLGDAAHPMMPHQSQGACMAIEDAAALGILFSPSYFDGNIAQTLQVYQEVRLPRATRVQAAAAKAALNINERIGFSSNTNISNYKVDDEGKKLTIEEMNADAQNREVAPIIINNEEQPFDTDRVLPVKNSVSGENVHHYASADTETCGRACDAAWNAFQTWRNATIAERRGLLFKVANLYKERMNELVEAQMKETACTEGWAKYNVLAATNYINESAACVSSVKGIIPPTDKPDTMTFVYKEPIGPVLVIPPWNAAVILSTRAISSAIVTGCTVVLKCSEMSPLTHTILVDIFRQAGCPPGVLNSIQTSRQDAAAVTESLIANEHIRKVEFIGSAAVGRIIAATAAKHLKPTILELGGKCPAIVLDDADLAKAARLCAQGAIKNHGQICFGTERIIVLRSVADDFIKLLVEEVKKTPAESAISESIAQNAVSILKDAKDKGAKFLCGDGSLQDNCSISNTLVLVDPKTSPDHLRIVDEETFGPSASVYIVDDDAEAIRIANRSAYGLNAAIHTRNLERAIKMGRQLEYGQVHTNSSTVYISPTGPQGGVKGSGWGTQNASWGLDLYYHTKQISWHGEDSGN
ncbi:aldehyde dehydrogenase, partial [Aureobasidium melanogenum]